MKDNQTFKRHQVLCLYSDVYSASFQVPWNQDDIFEIFFFLFIEKELHCTDFNFHLINDG